MANMKGGMQAFAAICSEVCFAGLSCHPRRCTQDLDRGSFRIFPIVSACCSADRLYDHAFIVQQFVDQVSERNRERHQQTGAPHPKSLSNPPSATAPISTSNLRSTLTTILKTSVSFRQFPSIRDIGTCRQCLELGISNFRIYRAKTGKSSEATIASCNDAL